MHAAISHLTTQKHSHETHRAHLQSEIAATQTLIRQRREAQASHQRALDAQARHNIPELRFWEEVLGLRIDGAGEERLRFAFGELGIGGDGEGWFEIDTGAVGGGFEVVRTEPRLEGEEVEAVVERANEARDLVLLLKGMRGLFVDALRG